MIPFNELLLFTGACFLLVITPGPNMLYLLSRSVCQGRAAGIVSLFGVLLGFSVHMLGAGLGLSAIFLAVPAAYEALRWAGVVYLLWLAWGSLKPGAQSPFAMRELPADSRRKLFVMGFVINALNPKVAMFCIALFPQFINPAYGSVFWQSMTLGVIQAMVSFTVNLMLVLSAASIASWFARNPTWMTLQRYVMGGVLAALAVRIMLEPRRVL